MDVGDKIPVQTQAGNYIVDQFPLAYIVDADGDPIVGSPFEMTPNEVGYYENTTALMPDSPWVAIDIISYSDAEHTEISQALGGDNYVVYLTSTGGSSFPPTSNIVAVVEPDGCSQAPIQDTIVKGSDRTLTVRLVENSGGEPFSLADWTEIVFRFRNADGSVLEISTEDAGSPVQVVSEGAGRILCVLTGAQTEDLAARIPAPFSIVVTKDDVITVVNVPSQLAIEDQEI